MTQKRLQILHFWVVVMLFAWSSAQGQGLKSPYFNLQTSINTTLLDTISGVDLDLNEASPVAKHGDVDINVIVPGGSGAPYVFEVQYTPDPGFVGVDTFVLEYRYFNNFPYLTYKGYRVCVLPSIVQANPDVAISNSGAPITIDVLANDFAPWGPLTITSIPKVNNGQAIITSDQQVLFTPEAGFTGVAHLNYVACDALNSCKTTSVEIGVNGGLPPSDTLQIFTNKNSPVHVPLTFGGYTMFQAPVNGTVAIHGGKSFDYAPNTGFHGTDQFVLKTVFNGVDYFRTIFVKVFNVSSPNSMATDDVVYTPKDKPITFNVRANDIGNLLVRSWVVPNNLPGTISGTNGAGNVTFTPNPGFSGVATFAYKIGNASAPALEIGTVNVVVDNLNPPSVFPHVLSTPKETPLVIRYNIPYQNFTFAIAQTPEHGVLEYFPGQSSHVLNGQTVSGNNLVIFTPAEDYVGNDEIALIYCAPNNQCQSVKIPLTVVEVESSEAPYCLASCAWPGDANMDGLVNNKDLLPMGYVLGCDGTARVDGNLEWYGQYSTNWNYPFPGLSQDLKHIDADGNGIINEGDIAGISTRYNRAHNLYPKLFDVGKGLPFSFELLTEDPGVGDLVRIRVLLGSPSIPAIDVYGFTFDMTLGQGIVDSAFKMTYFDNSWLNLNSPSIKMAERPAIGRFETAFSRTNGHPASGHGPIGEVEFVIIDIVVGGGQNSRPTLTVVPTTLLADGSTGAGAPIVLEIPIKVKGRNATAAGYKTNLDVFPTPASDQLFVQWQKEDGVEVLQLMDAQGKLLSTQSQFKADQTTFDVSKFPSGLYVLTAKTGQGVVSKKVQIVH